METVFSFTAYGAGSRPAYPAAMTALTLLGLLACTNGETTTTPATDSATGSCMDPCDTPSTAEFEGIFDATAFTPDPSLTRDNPLKGLMTSYAWGEPDNDFPDQLEFFYLPMKDLWDELGETLDSGLEPHLEAAAGRDHHAVVRVYIDYPGQESGLPDHLEALVDCQTYTNHGGGCSPDYDDPDLVSAMTGLIEALGERTDADPRLGYVQVGLLGFWGEWHTWPHEDWFASEQTQTAVLDAYELAFATTLLQMRYPSESSVSRRIGYHDDSFAYATVGDIDWFFVPLLEDAGAQDRWQEVAIGGEVYPELQTEIFEDAYQTGTYAQDLDTCIVATRASYLLDYQAFNEDGVGYAGAERERAEQAALRLGYQFEVVGAVLTATGLMDGTVEAQVSLEIAQTGVAPFYYPLFLWLETDGLFAANNHDLSTLLPGETQTVTMDLGRVPATLLNAPLTFDLRSDLVQDGQAVRFATETPWTGSNGELVLQWEVGCDHGTGDWSAVGEVTGTDGDGCACVCDVDGRSRACGQDRCD